MNLSRSVRAQLEEHLAALASGPLAIRSPKDLLRSVERVRERYGHGQAELVTQDRLEAAVAALARNPVPGRRQLFICAHAFAQPVRALDGRSLLDSPLGSQLLSHWERVADGGQLAASHWRGLFRSYMQAEPGETCQRLRRLLARSLTGLVRNGRPTPAWLSGVRRHVGLLGDTPGMPYLEELVSGTTQRLDDLKAEVDLPIVSWFWTSLRGAALQQIAALDESTFKERLTHLQSLPQRIPGSRDEILAALLGRFAGCQDRSRHISLMEFALEAWGSPQLKSNKLWVSVSEDARQMVCGWLAQEDLEDFYRLCKGSHQVDDRRLKFWLRFKEQMGYTQILLGGYLRSSRDGDIRAFIQKKKGRVGDLTSGPATNNAILMQIGGWLFIEFSETGNACFAFPIADSTVELGKKGYSLYQLKPSAKSVKRLIHMDGHEKWEQKFLTSLREVGVQPDDGKAVPNSARGQVAVSQSKAASRSPVPDAYKAAWGTRGALSDAEQLLARLRELDVRVVDNRSKGGAIWAYPNRNSQPHAELRALGMKYKSDKEGFYWP